MYICNYFILVVIYGLLEDDLSISLSISCKYFGEIAPFVVIIVIIIIIINLVLSPCWPGACLRRHGFHHSIFVRPQRVRPTVLGRGLSQLCQVFRVLRVLQKLACVHGKEFDEGTGQRV